MEYKDYYKVLGVERDAAQDEIKRAYRKLVRKHHPDVNKGPGAEESERIFKEAGEAYEVLQDPEKRAAYDRLGADWEEGQSFRPPPDWQEGFDFGGGGYTGADPGQFTDFFEELFARRGRAGGGSGMGYDMGSGRGGAQGGGAHRFHAPGQDHHARIEIDLAEAYQGGSRDFSLRAPELDASGQVVMRDRSIRVTIPKGVREGQHIRLAGQGAPGFGGGQAGDLYLEVEIREAPGYRVEGRDVFMDLPVTPWEAALGARVDVPTPAGRIELAVPKGAQAGKKLRLKGRGIPGKPPGDLFAVVKIVVPPVQSERVRDLYEQLRDESRFDPRARMKG